jgi:hypothetical protein
MFPIKNILLYNFTSPSESCVSHIEENERLHVSENRILRRIFGPNRKEETGEGKEVHNEEFEKLYMC